MPTPNLYDVVSQFLAADSVTMRAAMRSTAEHCARYRDAIRAGRFDETDTASLCAELAVAMASEPGPEVSAETFDALAKASEVSRIAAWLRSFPVGSLSQGFAPDILYAGTLAFYFAHVLATFARSDAPCGIPLDQLAESLPTVKDLRVGFARGARLLPEEIHFYRRLELAGRLGPETIAVLRRHSLDVIR